MLEVRVLWLLSTVPMISRSGFVGDYDYNKPVALDDVTADDALFLTPYIEKGQIEKARNLSVVPPLLENVESFAGYLTVNKTASSNIFFWLFKSQEGVWEERPLVVWLQGGPGTSSLLGLFRELGPFSLTHQKLKRRRYSWNRKYNLVFFDNPVGTGFSFTKMDSAYVQNEVDVARDLYVSLVQLYKLFPALLKNKLILTGESYAGKYIPAIAYKIHKMNKISTFKLNLAGLMIGNAFTDPQSMLNYSSYVYEIGLVDENLKEKLLLMEDQIRRDISAGNSTAAAKGYADELTLIQRETGLVELYDFVHDKITASSGPELQFINNPDTRRAIHVGNYAFNNGSETRIHLANDFVQSVKPWVEELLTAEEFPVMFYSGQLDIVVPYVVSVDFYNTLKWPYSSDYRKAKRCQFVVNGEVAGYYKTARTFTEVLVRNTGHMVPITQPKWAYVLLDRFITNSSSFKCG